MVPPEQTFDLPPVPGKIGVGDQKQESPNLALVAALGLQEGKFARVYQGGYGGAKRRHVLANELHGIPSLSLIGQYLKVEHGH